MKQKKSLPRYKLKLKRKLIRKTRKNLKESMWSEKDSILVFRGSWIRDAGRSGKKIRKEILKITKKITF